MKELARIVVLVEDDDDCASVLQIAVSRLSGIELVQYRRAEEALDWIESGHELSALVTDLHLPQMDGFELVRRVREERPQGTLPILVVSGDSQPDTPERAIGLGADAYISKPYSPADMRQILGRLLDEQDSPTDAA